MEHLASELLLLIIEEILHKLLITRTLSTSMKLCFPFAFQGRSKDIQTCLGRLGEIFISTEKSRKKQNKGYKLK